MKVVIDASLYGQLQLTAEAIIEFLTKKGIEYTEDVPDWAKEPGRKVIFAKTLDDDLVNSTAIIDCYRGDPELIKLIEEWGNKAVVTRCHPRIVEIPDDVDWYVTRGDVGQEWIAEKHRIWGFEND